MNETKKAQEGQRDIKTLKHEYKGYVDAKWVTHLSGNKQMRGNERNV